MELGAGPGVPAGDLVGRAFLATRGAVDEQGEDLVSPRGGVGWCS